MHVHHVQIPYDKKEPITVNFSTQETGKPIKIKTYKVQRSKLFNAFYRRVDFKMITRFVVAVHVE